MAEIRDERESGTRSRTHIWDDPKPSAEARQRLTGLEYLRGFLDGTFPPPPIAQTMGMRLVEVEEGRAVFACAPAEYHYNLIGAVHGGLAATLLDSAMGCAVHSTLPIGVGYTTVEIKVNYLRALTSETGTVRAEGHVIKVGVSRLPRGASSMRRGTSMPTARRPASFCARSSLAYPPGEKSCGAHIRDGWCHVSAGDDHRAWPPLDDCAQL